VLSGRRLCPIGTWRASQLGVAYARGHSLCDALKEGRQDVREDVDPYDAAVLALAAHRLAADSTSPEFLPAGAIRDSFGTWVEHIHAYAGADRDPLRAEAANEHIRVAFETWDRGGSEDLTAFAEQCRLRVAVVEAAWLQSQGPPLKRNSWIPRLPRRRLRQRTHLP
jgi:hypothetical protein